MGSTKASRIHPIRAPVRPRVIHPETGDAIPLDDVLLEVQGRSVRTIEILGDPGSGKSMALAHLAAILPPDRAVVLLDDPSPACVTKAADEATVVFTSVRPHSIPGTVSYRLVPWGIDELVEYLLAVHPAQCGSVMARLQAAPDQDLPRGIPELWQVVLDRMAEDESLKGVAEALRRELYQGLSTAIQRTGAEQYCLAELAELSKQAAKCYLGLGRLHIDARVLRLLRHDAVRLTLATDRLVELLESKSGDRALEERLPRELVRAVAAIASSTAIENLSRWMAKRRDVLPCHGCQPAACYGQRMVPRPPSAAIVVGRYLDGATWKAVNLAGARIVGTDLSTSDLTEAILDGALASAPISAVRCCIVARL